MSDRLFLVESDATGLRAALVEDRRLQAIEIDGTRHPTRVGSVAAATVLRTVQGLGTIVKLADGTELLLDRGGPTPKAGDEIAVQLTHPPRGDKLGTATRAIACTGRGVVHLPLDLGIKFSRRLEIDEARRGMLEPLVAGKPGAWIFRCGAGHIDEADFAAEIATLAAEGQGAEIAAPDAFRRLATDWAAEPPDRILTAGLAARRTVERWCRAFAPSVEARMEPVDAGLFDLYDVDEAVSALGEPRVMLPGGASLVIEPTEALTVIDVNAGPAANALSVNLTAAAEIGRQLRLRHIGGIVVIDFISGTQPRERERIVEALKSAVADDPSQTYILPMSALGLVEMTRESRGPGLELER